MNLMIILTQAAWPQCRHEPNLGAPICTHLGADFPVLDSWQLRKLPQLFLAAMTLLSLNYDVLSLILALISAHDASQLALTCRHAYSIALPRFLSDVTLGGVFHKSRSSAAKQLTDFCAFMLAANEHRRLQCLQRIQIMRDAVRCRVDGRWTVDASCVAMLSDVLGRASHLHTLTLWGPDALFAAHPPLADALARLPLLHSVVLGGDIPPLPTLVRAFPHVRSLQFVDGGGSCGPDWDLPSLDSVSSWPSLDRVDTGHPILSLVCPVRRVDLRNPLFPDEFVLANALEFVAHTRPVVLSCAVDGALTDAEFCAPLAGVASGLRFLELVLDRCDSMPDVVSWMTRVAHALAPLPLLGLSLCRSGTTPPKDHLSATAPSLDALARTIAEAVPTLQYVGLQPHGQRAYNVYDPEWFRASSTVTGRGDGSARRVERVGAEEGLSVQRTMQALDRYD
ncbi:hypothetical protein A0H81_02138 [Grifola frondosa]|uniref:F-box domain-containing protein n=1 Tax=Grifola frondosa TaxID=5627 RepID=A0A1C7MM36_GRIFR|nr:hypothetical protein A0H81_02138 [Grifola frondosa]